MAKPIKFTFGSFDFESQVTKVDRKKLYGYSKIDVSDSNGSKCSLVTLSDDGAHILPSGSTGITKLDNKGNYVESSSIKVIRADGSDAEKIPSAFTRGLILQEVESLDEYFDLNVKSIYQLSIDPEAKTELLQLLSDKEVLKTDFNYRDGYDADDAFLLTADEEVFLIVGSNIVYEYLGNEVIQDLSQEEEDDDDFDFGML